MSTFKDEKQQALVHLLQLAKNDQELGRVLSDLLTESEISKIYERMHIVDSLHNGNSQRKTVKETGAAIATVGRGGQLMRKPELVLPTFLQRAHKMAWWSKFFWRA